MTAKRAESPEERGKSMARRKGRPGTGITLLILLGIFVVVFASVTIRGKIEQKREEKAAEEAAIAAEAYDASMAPLRQEGYICSETADKAVVLLFEEADSRGVFTDEGIPAALLCETAADVRFLVSVSYGTTAYTVDTYNGTAEVYDCIAEVTDLLTGNVIAEKHSLSISSEGTEARKVEGFTAYEEGRTVYLWLSEAIEEGLLEQEAKACHAMMAPALSSDGHVVSGFRAIALVKAGQDEPLYQMRYIPEDLRAETPEEVRYVVHCDLGSRYAGIYLGGGNAAIQVMDIRVEDLLSGKTVARTTLEGSDPPEYTTGNSGGIGEPPTDEEVQAWVTSVLGTAEEQEQKYLYHTSMAAVLNDSTFRPSGNKAVGLLRMNTDGDMDVYQTEYIPETYLAQDPAEVRYVVKCGLQILNVGFYGGGGNAYQYVVTVEVVDLTTGKAVDSAEFEGGQPAQQSEIGVDQYGSMPAESTITNWLSQVLASLG